MKKSKIKRKNVPEFTPPEPNFIECVGGSSRYISETELKSAINLTRYYFNGSFYDYIYEINFPKDSLLQKVERYSFCFSINYITCSLPKCKLFSRIYSITFPPSLQIIDSYAFGKCNYLNQISFLKNDDDDNFLEEICKKAFTDTKLESIIIPKNIKIIGSQCFPKTLKSIEFENGAPKLEKIDDYAFYNTQIEKISLPLNVSPLIVSNNVFLNCRKLNTVIFDQYISKEEEVDESLISIDDDLCRSLLLSQTKIENLEIYATALKKFSFFNTPKLTSITIPKGEYAKYVKQNGCLYTKDNKKLIVAERNIKSATINSKCQSIENYAFNIKSLEKVSFENNSKLQEISLFAFSESQLKKLSIPKAVNSILEGAFYGCNKLDSINLPNSIQKLEYCTFSYTNLSEVKIPKSVTKISYGCFYKCSKLSSVSFKEDSELEEIENYAFAETSISSISIPKSVKTIGDFCFINCHKLKTITFEENSILSYLGNDCFIGTKIEEFQLPKMIEYCHFSNIKAKVISIPSHCYLNEITNFQSTQITEITIPSTVTKICGYAFLDCTNLSVVKMVDPDKSKLTIIEKGAFFDCQSLKEFKIPKTVYNFGRYSFKNCSHLNAKIKILSKSVYVGKSAFLNSGILSFEADCDLVQVNDFAFQDCKNLKKVDLNADSNCFLGSSSFMNCTSLTDVKIKQEVKEIKIEKNCFYNTSIVEFEFPNNLKKVTECSFKLCKNLTHVSFSKESQIKVFEDESFYESGVKSIALPPKATKIGKSCFENCKVLKEVTFSEPYEKSYEIDDNAFSSTSIKEMHFPKSYWIFGFACFKDCTKLQAVTFAEESTVNSIPESLFESCSIESIILPNLCQKIEKYAFKNCKQLSSVTMNRHSDCCIHFNAFEGCSNLSEVKNADESTKVNVMLNNGERDCLSLVRFSQMPTDKNVINAILTNSEPPFKYASFFDMRNSLLLNEKFDFELNLTFYQLISIFGFVKLNLDKDVLTHRTVKCINGGYFLNKGKKIFFCDFSLDSLIIPKETEIIKSFAFKFTNLKKIDFEKGSKLKKIKKSSFEDLQIEEISIPNSVTSIGDSAFRSCHQLKKVNINKESQLTTIGESAFEKTSIESILFPSTLKQINQLAFYDCINLTKVENYSNDIHFGYQSFYNSSVETINFPSKSEFDESSFKNCRKLKQLTFLESPQKLVFGIESFAYSGLEELKFECDVQIKENAFIYCSSLKQITFKGKKIECFTNSFANDNNIESCIMNMKSLKYTAKDILNDLYSSTIEKVSLTLKCKDQDQIVTQKIFLNHKCYVVDNVLEYSNLIDNVSLYEKNPPGKKVQIKKNEVLRVPSNVKKLNLTVMSHIKKIQWASNCIVEDLGCEGLFSYYSLTDITIPKMVKKIEPHLFEHCHYLKDVQFEEGSILEEIGDYGFANTRIKSIDLPKTVKRIGDFAFFNDFHLTGVVFEGKTIGEKAFSFTALKSFKLSNNTESIGTGAFRDCHSLASFDIDVENSILNEIGDHAFSETSITEFNIPPLVKSINDYTFDGCTSLKEVTFSIKSNIEKVTLSPFKKCISLKSIKAPEKIFELLQSSYEYDNNDYYCAYFIFEGQKIDLKTVGEEKIESPCYVTKIKQDGQLYCPDCYVENDCYVVNNELKYVHLIDNSLLYQKVTSSDQSESDIKANEVLHVPSGVTKLDFPFMSHIKYIKWAPNCSLTDLGSESFFSYYSLVEITIPKLVKVIPNRLFDHCHYLKTVQFESGSKLTGIGSFGFTNTSIEQIDLPKTVQIIGDSCFFNCLNLKAVNFEGKMIGDEAFAYSGLTAFNLSSKTKSIGSGAFQYCKSLKNFQIDVESSNLTEIGSYAFSESSIEIFNFPQKVKLIKSSTFDGCRFLKEVNFTSKSSLSIIEDYAFAGNLALETINIPKSIKKLATTAFINTPMLKYIMNKPNQSFKVMKNYTVYGKDGTLYFVPRNLTKYRIMKNCFIIHSGAFCGPCIKKVKFSDNSTVEFEKCAFAHATALNKIQMPNSLRLIGDEAFLNCQSLERVEFEPATKLKEIPNFCFAFSGLKIIKLPISIEVIKNSSFYFCQHLKSVNLGDTSVKYIGDNAFCEANLNEVKLPKSCRFIGSHAFGGNRLIKLIDMTKLAQINDTVQLPIISFVRNVAKSNKRLSKAIHDFVKKEAEKQLQQSNEKQETQENSEVIHDGDDDNENSNNENEDNKKLPPISLNMISKKNPVIIKPSASSSRPTSSRVSSPTKGGRQNVLPVLPPVEDQQNKSPRKVGKQNQNKNLNGDVQTIKFEYHEQSKDDDDSKRCYIHEFAFDKSTAKLFNFDLEEFNWFYFFDSCSRIEQYSVNENVHLYLHKLVKEKPKPNSLTGQYFRIKRLDEQSDFSIPLSKKSRSSSSVRRIISPFNFFDFAKLIIVTFTEDIKIEEIPKFCFASTALKEIALPSSVSIINQYAFFSCRSLSKVVIPQDSKLSEIKENAFFGCRRLASINLPNLIQSISRKCFASSGLKSIKMPKSTKTIGEMAFYSCIKLTRVKLNKGIKEIGKFSFANNPLLESIDIPDSLRIIKDYSFSNCSNLKQVNTTENTKLVEIHNGSFENTLIEKLGVSCKAKKLFQPIRVPKLNEITFHQGKPKNFYQTDDGVIYEKKDKIKVAAPVEQTKEKEEAKEKEEEEEEEEEECEVDIEDWVDLNAQSNQVDSFLQLLFVPKNLECLKIHPNCKCFSKAILDDMVNLQMIEYSEGATNYVKNFPYYNRLFTGQRNKLKEIKILGKRSMIESNCFSHFGSLESIEFGENTEIRCIPNFAFLDCQKVTKIAIPSSCLSICDSAFKDCINLETVEFKKDGRLKTIENDSFYNCTSLKSIVLPSSLEAICNRSFMNCKSLEKVEFTDFVRSKLSSIGKSGFRNCVSLLSFKLPSKINSLGLCCFIDCTNLQDFEYEGSDLIEINCRTFMNCEKLSRFSFKIIADDEDSSVGFSIKNEAFANCTSLKEISIENGSQNYETIDFNKEKVPIPQYRLVSFYSPKIIGKKAFFNCKSLTKARFFISRLTYFDESAFENCSSLKLIEINSIYWALVMTENLRRNAFSGTDDQLEVKIFNKGQFAGISYKVDNKPKKVSEKRHYKQHLSSLNKDLICPKGENKGEIENRMIVGVNVFFQPIEKRDIENSNNAIENDSQKVNNLNDPQEKARNEIEKVDDLNENKNSTEKIEKSSEKVKETDRSEKVECPIDKIIRKRHFQQFLSSLNRSFIAWFVPDKIASTKETNDASNNVKDENTKYHHKKLPLYGECVEFENNLINPGYVNVNDNYNYLYQKPLISLNRGRQSFIQPPDVNTEYEYSIPIERPPLNI